MNGIIRSKKEIELLVLRKFNYIKLILLISTISLTIDIYTKKQLLFLPLITSLLISTLITQWGIKKLKKLQFKQIIRAEGPQAHFKKSGTPSMGGIIIVPLGIIIGNIISQNSPILADFSWLRELDN